MDCKKRKRWSITFPVKSNQIVTDIFKQLPYKDEYQVQLRDDSGKMLHIKNKKHLERLAKQLLLQVSKENLKLLLTWISWEGIRRPNLAGSWHMDWMNTLHHDPDVYEILVFQ